jgi:hypothetical protein
MRRCKTCDVVLVPVPQIESLTGEPLEICISCLKEGVEQLDKISRTQIAQ